MKPFNGLLAIPIFKPGHLPAAVENILIKIFDGILVVAVFICAVFVLFGILSTVAAIRNGKDNGSGAGRGIAMVIAGSIAIAIFYNFSPFLQGATGYFT